jgi:all-trans-retinol 13,14-reductase
MKPTISYKQHDLEDNWDAIVIGSGIGGLGTAAILAKEGQKVLVLEQHYTAGGFTHVFKRPGYEWDVGLHYIGEVNRQNSMLKRLFDYVTEGELAWEDMGEVYDKICIGDEEFPFHKGTENFKAELKERFRGPEDQRAIDDYVDLVWTAAKAGQKFFMEKALPPLVGKVAGPLMRRKYMKFARRTTEEVLRELTDNDKLIAVLTGQWGDYGLPPAQGSFAMHALVARHYFGGGAYPVGGSGAILETIAPVIQRSGGQVVTNARVDRIDVVDGEAKGVTMADGRSIEAPIVISDAGFENTWRNLVARDVAREAGVPEQLEHVQPSASHICLYIGLQKTAEELDLPRANYWLYPENIDHEANLERFAEDPENAPLPVAYISFPSAKDPDWENRYPGTATIEIITVAPYEWFEKWEGTRWKKRGDDYDAFKEMLSQRLLRKLYEKEPQVEGEIDHYELSTPLSTKHFANYQSGEIYGLAHTPDRFEQTFLRAHTPVKDLFLTGQDIASCGIGGALSASMITVGAILKKDITKKVWAETSG